MPDTAPVNPRKESTMPSRFDHVEVANGDLVLAKDMVDALTAATLVFEDGASQTFTADGKTTYVERTGSSQGEWSIVQDGEFSSFWPPDYRAAYTLRWIVEDGAVTGLSFIQAGRGDRFDGRYETVG
jgi:capsid portal protein